MTEKKVPMRTCIACRTSKPKRELVRVVKSGDNVFADFTGKANGRGAYVCRCAECVAKLKKSRLLNRVFSCEVEESVYESVAEAILGNEK